jgi:hypothetical protein
MYKFLIAYMKQIVCHFSIICILTVGKTGVRGWESEDWRGNRDLAASLGRAGRRREIGVKGGKSGF